MDHNGLVALCLFGVITLSHGSIVDTEYGQVSGHILNVDNGRDGMMPIEVFHGIPFAKDTSGSGRFAVSIVSDSRSIFILIMILNSVIQ